MWTVKLKDVPETVSRLSVSLKGKIYSFALWRSKSYDFIDVYIFYPASYRWDVVKTQPLHGGRPMRSFDSAVVAYGDSAYVCGGWTSQGPDSAGSVYRFDTTTMAWSCPQVSGDKPRSHCHSACVVGHRMYIISCRTVGSLQHIHFLDLDTYKWHRIETSGDAPACPGLNSACTIGGRIYVWGGTARDNSVFYLDTVTSTWVRPNVEGVAPECRFNHSVFVYKGEMYIFGGYSRELYTLFADLHKYDPGRSCWTQVRPKRSGPCGRVYHACCVIGDRAFVFRGFHPKPTGGGQSAQTDREHVSPSRLPEEELTDLYVLDFAPKLQTLCILALIDARIKVDDLPDIIMKEVNAMADDDSTSPSP